MRSDDLLAAVFPDVAACQENIEGDIKIPDHPLVAEVMKDVLTEAMDIDASAPCSPELPTAPSAASPLTLPSLSQFSHEILNANPTLFLDDAPLEERPSLRRPWKIAPHVARIGLRKKSANSTPPPSSKFREEGMARRPRRRRIAHVLHTFIALPEFPPDPSPCMQNPSTSGGRCFRPSNSGTPCFAGLGERPSLLGSRRARRTFSLLYNTHVGTAAPGRPGSELPSFADALLATVIGWMAHVGPPPPQAWANSSTNPRQQSTKPSSVWNPAASVLRGNFTSSTDETEWCERRLLARIHRLTLGTLRKQIQPPPPHNSCVGSCGGSTSLPIHSSPGERGLREVLNQLQGFEIPANAWEPRNPVPPRRQLRPQWLDQLCLTGAVGWGRLSPHPATLEDSAQGKRRVIPTSVAPVHLLHPRRRRLG